MSRYIIAVMDSARARFLTLKPAEFSESAPHLIEHESLISPAGELKGEELWSSSKTGRNRGSSGQAHSYDDHREGHVAEFERHFAQEITNHISDLIQTHRVQQLLLVTEPKILGLMREMLVPIVPKDIKISELAKNLCQLKPHELYEYLVSKELLPSQKKDSSLA
jgi:protein required for attachment to host cells